MSTAPETSPQGPVEEPPKAAPKTSPAEPLLRRLWIYQAERFPLARTIPLLAVFSAASVNVSALLAGRPLPGAGAYLTAAALSLGIFFQMRAFDEAKDAEDDRRFRPERPIPRGLVSLRLIIRLAGATGAAMLALAAAWTPGTLLLLLLAWSWLGLMTAEFFAPSWLKARPLAYLLSHMAIMPLIDLMLTGVEWTAAPGSGHVPAMALWLFLGLSFVNGTVLEIGRKTWAPENERPGVETYSKLWGPARAALIWLAVVGLGLVLLLTLGLALGAFWPIALVGVTGFALAARAALGFRRAPSPAAQTRLDTLSGLWVLACYGAAGFLPLVFGG
ncbi:MAG: manganese transporter permease [Rhodobacterales bacterium]|nr:MAG: manganese transporter permease [Rhodobacterales bacterium]